MERFWWASGIYPGQTKTESNSNFNAAVNLRPDLQYSRQYFCN